MIFQQESSIDKRKNLSMVTLMSLYSKQPESVDQPELYLSDDKAETGFIRRLESALRKYRHTLLLVAGLTLNSSLSAQSSQGVDYSTKSNVINPDTLMGDEKAIFWHFVDKTSQELKTMLPAQIKADFAILGLLPEERQRFVEAYSFFVNRVEAHKVDCEMWEDFKYLAPKKDK